MLKILCEILVEGVLEPNIGDCPRKILFKDSFNHLSQYHT